MASINCMKYPYCVEWTTELPYKDISRTSSDIFLEGSKWNLELSSNSYGDFILQLAADELNQKHIEVSSFIHDPSDHSSVVNMAKSQLLELDYDFFEIGRKSKGEIKKAFPNIFCTGTLIITCVFHFVDTPLDKISAHVSTQTTLNNVDLQSLSQDFSTFRKDETFSDVKLKCADQTFSANRFVLAARSEVFAAMFRNKMAEAEIGVVQIKDVDPEVLEMLLQYMYSGQSPDLCEETAQCVYETADKYDVYGLRRACSDWMIEHQTTDNCLDLLVLAEDHSDDEFKNAVTYFVAEHLSDIDVESWSAFRINYPLLVLSILEKRCQDLMPSTVKTTDKELSPTDKQCNNVDQKN